MGPGSGQVVFNCDFSFRFCRRARLPFMGAFRTDVQGIVFVGILCRVVSGCGRDGSDRSAGNDVMSPRGPL
jgi:hypothetical protein